MRVPPGGLEVSVQHARRGVDSGRKARTLLSARWVGVAERRPKREFRSLLGTASVCTYMNTTPPHLFLSFPIATVLSSMSVVAILGLVRFRGLIDDRSLLAFETRVLTTPLQQKSKILTRSTVLFPLFSECWLKGRIFEQGGSTKDRAPNHPQDGTWK